MATIDRRGVSVSAVDTPIAGNPNPGLAIKAPCLVATTGNIALSGLQTVDGVALAAGNRVLVWQQADATTNGLYNAATGPWTRTIDCNSNDQLASGMLAAVTAGATYAAQQFTLTTPDPVALGTSALAFSNSAAGGTALRNGGPLGSPSSIGTLPAFALGGTINGGGNQLNDIIIGNVAPAPGGFTNLVATHLFSNSTLTIDAFTLGGTLNGGGNQLNDIIIGNVTPLAGAFTNLLAGGTTIMGTNATLPGGGSTVAAVNGNAGTTINTMAGFGPQLVVVGPDGNRGAMALQSYMQSGAGSESSYLAFTARGSMASPASIQSGDFVGEFFAHGATITGGFQFLHNAGAGLVMVATDNYLVGAAGEQINVYTTPKGTGTAALNSVFNDSGGLTITSGEPALFLNKNTAGSPPGIPSAFGSNALLRMIEADTVSPVFAMQSFSTGFNPPTLLGLAARGTGAAPTATQSGDFLMESLAYGYATSSSAGYVTNAGAGLIITATENYTMAAAGARVDIYATPAGTAALATGASVGAGLMVGTTSDPGAGKIVATKAIRPGSFTVATLPAGVTGDAVWASNCRVFNGAGTQEGAGSGTGGWVTYNGSAWKIAGTNITAVA